MLFLTPAGQELVETMLPKLAEHEADFLSALEPEEQETLHALLRKLNGS